MPVKEKSITVQRWRLKEKADSLWKIRGEIDQAAKAFNDAGLAEEARALLRASQQIWNAYRIVAGQANEPE